ncbi:MAG TPA: hypothetical protein VJT74_01555 [Pyrinomonadaceae bacterium]|nr:hypothetical protein [Pyrinomonadaceae bacterium]
MGEQVVETIYNADRTRRVIIFRRGDGTFGFEELRFGAEEQEWFPCGCRPVSFTDSADAALGEARGRVRWLAEAGADE